MGAGKRSAATARNKATNFSVTPSLETITADRGIRIEDDEIFVSDGSKCDCGNILDIFGHQNRIAVVDPVYPVYVDTNVMAGHTGSANGSGAYEGLVYLPCTKNNGFVPEIPGEPSI